MPIVLNNTTADAEFLKELIGNKKVSGTFAAGAGLLDVDYTSVIYYANGLRFSSASGTVTLTAAGAGTELRYIYGKDDDTIVGQSSTTSSLNFTLLAIVEVNTTTLVRISPVANAAINTTLVKNNLSATTNPAVTDDSGLGYTYGSVWVNTLSSGAYMCVDPTLGAAVWDTINNAIPPGTVDLGMTLDSGKTGTIGSGSYLSRSGGVALSTAPYVIPFACEIVAVSAYAGSLGSQTSFDIQIHKNSVPNIVETLSMSAVSGYKSSTGVGFAAGDLIYITTGNYAPGTGTNPSNIGATLFLEKS